MSLLGVHLTLLIGRGAPAPAPPRLLEALDSVEVRQPGEGSTSAFQLTFRVGRGGARDLSDYPLLRLPLLAPDNRVVLTVTLRGRPRVLMDGIIAQQRLEPGNRPGAATLTVKGVDLSGMMDRERRTAEHPGLPDREIVHKLCARYARHGVVPRILPTQRAAAPNPVRQVPVQRCTDLEYITTLGQRHGYVFAMKPGPVPLTCTAYWGPPLESTVPQRALSVNLGGETNVTSLDFQHDGETPARVSAEVQDSGAGRRLPARTFTGRRPPLALFPALGPGPGARRELLDPSASGLPYAEVLGRAQARTDITAGEAVAARGELDVMRYGDVLEPRRLVGVRGAGFLHDGSYIVRQVTHVLRKGEYRQSFTLAREGLGSTTQVV